MSYYRSRTRSYSPVRGYYDDETGYSTYTQSINTKRQGPIQGYAENQDYAGPVYSYGPGYGWNNGYDNYDQGGYGRRLNRTINPQYRQDVYYRQEEVPYGYGQYAYEEEQIPVQSTKSIYGTGPLSYTRRNSYKNIKNIGSHVQQINQITPIQTVHPVYQEQPIVETTKVQAVQNIVPRLVQPIHYINKKDNTTRVEYVLINTAPGGVGGVQSVNPGLVGVQGAINPGLVGVQGVQPGVEFQQGPLVTGGYDQGQVAYTGLPANF